MSHLIITEALNENESSWANLPALVIEKMYTYLDRTDQMNMSLTCKNWLNEFSQPGLWKNFTFYLRAHSSTMETWPEVKFTEKFGYMFRHVKIICESNSANETSKAHKQLGLFLEHLAASGTQLLSIKFINLSDFFQHLTEEENSSLFQYTFNLINSQNQLQTIQFNHSYYAEEDGVKLLKLVCKNCNNLRTLVLIGFTKNKSGNNETNPNSARIYKNLALQFLHLETLEVDYSEMFENIFRSFQDFQYMTKHINKRLSSIVIICDGSEEGDFQGIPSMAWKVIRKICPTLEIQLIHSCLSQMRNPTELYLVKNMPVRKLSFALNDLLQTRHIEVEQFFQLIMSSKINEHVKSFCLLWISQWNNIFIHLSSFLNACSKICVFFISLNYPVVWEDIGNFFRSLLNNHPSTLRCLRVIILNVPDDEKQLQLTALADEYTPLFKAIRLNVFLTAEIDIVVDM